MKIKLGKQNMFLIILASLILSSSLGWFMREGFSKSDNKDDNSNTGNVNPVQIDDTINDVSNKGLLNKDIPKGKKDLYILKSQIVPPVCPACPSVTTCPSEKKCRPCPPCARCPEPSFECKKVPNYSSANNNSIPRPILNDFSSFGM